MKSLAFGLAVLASCQFAFAISSDNPYVDTITNRNLFSLKAPPDPASLVPPVVPPPLPDVKLAGITTLMGSTRAILRVMRPAKPPEPAKEISLFLSPGGAAEDGVQVLDIDVAHGLVKIVNGGTPQTLDITKNAPKAAAAPAPAPAAVGNPAVPAIPPVPPPRGATPMPSVTSVNRPMRGVGEGGVVGAGPNQMGNVNAPPPIVSAEEQAAVNAVLYAQEQAKVDAGIIKKADMFPYPPTELNVPETPDGPGGGGPPQLPQ